MDVTMKNGSIIINGKSFVGRNIIISDDKVIVDGQQVECDAEKQFDITINGTVESLETKSGNVRVSGSVNRIKTVSGDVTVKECAGHINTISGDVKAKTIDCSVNTVSGDIYKIGVRKLSAAGIAMLKECHSYISINSPAGDQPLADKLCGLIHKLEVNG